MKKILVLSDSHGYFEKILKIYEKENPDIVIYVGDGTKDIEELSLVHNSEYHIVNGNCDIFGKDFGWLEIFTVESIKFLITHGHMFYVKNSLEDLKKVSEEKNVDVIIYGHTHKEYLEYYKDRYLFNPGASQDGKYGIITIENGENIKFFHNKI